MAHLLRRIHAGILVRAGASPGSGNLHRVSRRTVTNKTSQARDLNGEGLPCLASSSAPQPSSSPLPGVEQGFGFRIREQGDGTADAGGKVSEW